MYQEQPQRVDAGQEARAGFGETSLARVAETSSVALAEQAKAAVSARYIMALQRPRDLMIVRQKLLADCKRPLFAEAAIYNKPVGDGVKGPSIRFAEAAARAMGNILAEVTAIYDDVQKRIVRVSVTDLEANITYPKDVTIEKTIERSSPPPGRKILGTRKNSKGRDVFIIEATSDEILDKENALCSKAMRSCLLRVIPGDLQEEAIEQCYETRRGEVKKDPALALKKLVDAFGDLGIKATQLAEYFGHSLEEITPEEIDSARSMYHALKDKETTWAEVMDAIRAERGAQPQAGPIDANGNGSLADRMAAKANATKTEPKAEEAKPDAKPAPREVKAEPAPTNAKPRGQSRFEG
jgi:hypothetical protein